MIKTVNCLVLALSAMASGLLSAEVSQPDTDGFRRHVAPLFVKYCIDCHGSDDPEAKLSLDAIDANLLDGADLETWRMIDEQIRFGEMPPKGELQPTLAERQAILNWIRQELLKTQMPGAMAEGNIRCSTPSTRPGRPGATRSRTVCGSFRS